MSREILQQFDEAGIGIASGTYEVVGMPPIKVQMLSASGESAPDGGETRCAILNGLRTNWNCQFAGNRNTCRLPGRSGRRDAALWLESAWRNG